MIWIKSSAVARARSSHTLTSRLTKINSLGLQRAYALHACLETITIKDIVLSVPLSAGADSTIDYAVSLAATFNARMTGIAFAYEQMPIGLLGDETWVASIEQLRKEAEDAAKAAIGRLQRAARAVDVSNDTRWISATY